MISKLVRKMIEERFGHPVRYSKECDALTAHIASVCKTTVSPTTMRRLLGFVKPAKEPRLYTLDIIANYLGFEGWDKLIITLEKDREAPIVIIDKLKAEQVKKGETVSITYEPGKAITLRKAGSYFRVLASNEKKIHADDEVKFAVAELHYPLSFSDVVRRGNSMGRVQVAAVSGITSIKKMQ